MGATNLVTRAAGPHHLYIAQGDRGPPTIVGLDAPDQGADLGFNGPLGPLVERSIQQ